MFLRSVASILYQITGGGIPAPWKGQCCILCMALLARAPLVLSYVGIPIHASVPGVTTQRLCEEAVSVPSPTWFGEGGAGPFGAISARASSDVRHHITGGQ